MKFRVLAVVGVALLSLVLMRAVWQTPVATPPTPETVPTTGVPEQKRPRVATSTPTPAPEPAIAVSPAPAATNNWLLRLMSENAATDLPREAIDRWLTGGRTNAEDLLAARQAGGGVEFLRMALTNFPNDPRVLLASVALNDGPEATRERLDRFKANAPDNAIADYLSARDHLKNGRPDEAIADLLAATGKSSFNDYALDAMQNAEDLYLQSGKSPAEAKMLGVSTALLPQLAQFKGLAQDMATLQRQYLAAGDTASAENLARMGVQLGQQLFAGESSRTLISQLVGVAIERIVLNPLDPAKTYEFLQGSPQDRFAQLDAYRADVRKSTQFLDQWMRTASDADLISYADRFKLYGESATLKWLQSRQKRGEP